jgi:hypothetical protein
MIKRKTEIFWLINKHYQGHAVAQLVAVLGYKRDSSSILDGIIAIFHSFHPSGRNTALGSTHPLKEMSTRNISWRIKATNAYG